MSKDIVRIIKTEKRNTVAQACPDGDNDLYPLDEDPMDWRSCKDACEFTWLSSSNDEYFEGVSSRDRLRLARSSGFCPHLRCQLDNVGSAAVSGACPTGLCYHKLLQGTPTFGACCYTNGVFNSTKLVREAVS